MTDVRGCEVDAAAVQPTTASWWTTVLGPGTGESQPMAHSRIESPSKRQEPHRAQSADRGKACWGTCPTETPFNKSAVENPKYDLPVIPKTKKHQSDHRFQPVMDCRSDSPCVVQLQGGQDGYRVPGSVVDSEEVGSSQLSFEKLNSGFARRGVASSTSCMPLNGHWQCMVRGDSHESQQRTAGPEPAGMCLGDALANVSALGRHSSEVSFSYPASPSPFHHRGPVMGTTFNYSSAPAPQGGPGSFLEHSS